MGLKNSIHVRRIRGRENVGRAGGRAEAADIPGTHHDGAASDRDPAPELVEAVGVEGGEAFRRDVDTVADASL